MNDIKKLKLLLAQYNKRHINTIQRYFAGSQNASQTVASKMEKLTGIRQIEWRFPKDLGVRPWHYCIYKLDETIDTLENKFLITLKK